MASQAAPGSERARPWLWRGPQPDETIRSLLSQRLGNPGLAIQRVDIPIITGVTLVSATAIVLGILLADLITP